MNAMAELHHATLNIKIACLPSLVLRWGSALPSRPQVACRISPVSPLLNILFPFCQFLWLGRQPALKLLSRCKACQHVLPRTDCTLITNNITFLMQESSPEWLDKAWSVLKVWNVFKCFETFNCRTVFSQVVAFAWHTAWYQWHTYLHS